MENNQYVRLTGHPLTDRTGSLCGWRYDIGLTRNTLKEAIDDGYEYYGCDDFCIGVISEGNIVTINYMDKPLNYKQESIDEINTWYKSTIEQ